MRSPAFDASRNCRNRSIAASAWCSATDYRIEKLVLEPEPGIQLPALLFSPPKPDAEAVLYLHGQGKQADAAEGGPIEQLVAKGHIVLAVDLRGMGETENRGKKWYGATFGPAAGEYFLAYLLGKSLVGLVDRGRADVRAISREFAMVQRERSASSASVRPALPRSTPRRWSRSYSHRSHCAARSHHGPMSCAHPRRQRSWSPPFTAR